MFKSKHIYKQINENHQALKLELQELKQKNEELELNLKSTRKICHALWEILKEKEDLSEDALTEQLQSLNPENPLFTDNQELVPWVCPECERTNPAQRDQCLYCGCQVD